MIAVQEEGKKAFAEHMGKFPGKCLSSVFIRAAGRGAKG